MNRRQKKLIDIPAHEQDPLSAALAGRNRGTMDMVEDAVRSKNCMLAYQPVLQSRPPHGVAFYEGLIRVMDATGRVIPAREFMPTVENAELGREIDCVALEMGLRTLSRHPDIRLSLNMSARSIGYRRWMRVLDRFMTKDKSLGARLILEISEQSAMTVPEIVIDFMDRLQDRGISFALDDFGSGSMTFRYFKDFFFDAAKIDGQFVRGVHKNHDQQSLVRALVAIAREFDMFTIAESVESEADAAFLVSEGVDCLQGYLYGAPQVRPPWKQDNDLTATG